MSFHPTDGGAVIYDPTDKRLFALNTTAAFVWLAVRDGRTHEAIRSELAATFELTEDEAENWMDQTLSSLGQLISDGADRRDEVLSDTVSTLSIGTDYRLLDKILRISAPDAALQLIDSMMGHLRRSRSDPPPDNADVSISIEVDGQNFVVSSSGDPTVIKQPRELVAEVERRIVQDLVPRVPHFLAFHAALLDWWGRAVLFPAPSGSGKTTLSAVLARQSWYCMTDEMALLDRSLSWQGLPFLPCIKAENYPLIASLYPTFGDVVEHERAGRQVKFLPLPMRTGRVQVSTVIFPEYRVGAEGALEPLQPLDGLQRLLGLCVYVPPGFTAADVPKLLKWHKEVEYFSFKFSSPSQAVRMCEQVRKVLGEGAASV